MDKRISEKDLESMERIGVLRYIPTLEDCHCEELKEENLDFETRFVDNQKTIQELEKKVGELEGALMLYGSHLYECDSIENGSLVCTCGFEALQDKEEI